MKYEQKCITCTCHCSPAKPKRDKWPTTLVGTIDVHSKRCLKVFGHVPEAAVKMLLRPTCCLPFCFSFLAASLSHLRTLIFRFLLSSLLCWGCSARLDDVCDWQGKFLPVACRWPDKFLPCVLYAIQTGVKHAFPWKRARNCWCHSPRVCVTAIRKAWGTELELMTWKARVAALRFTFTWGI